MHIKQIVNSVFTSNTFILSDNSSSDCWLIDIGDIQPVLHSIPEGRTIKGVFITHTHYDHIYGINELIRNFPDCTVYTSQHGKEGLYSEKLNFSRYHNDSLIFSGTNVWVLKNEDKIEIFPGMDIHILETPGHDWSCLTYYAEKEIFTGDSYIPGIKVIATFPHSNKEDAEISKKEILKLTHERKIYPGHGDIF